MGLMKGHFQADWWADKAYSGGMMEGFIREDFQMVRCMEKEALLLIMAEL